MNDTKTTGTDWKQVPTALFVYMVYSLVAIDCTKATAGWCMMNKEHCLASCSPQAEFYCSVNIRSRTTYAQRPPTLSLRESADDLALHSQQRIRVASNIPDDIAATQICENSMNLVLLKCYSPGKKKIY